MFGDFEQFSKITCRTESRSIKQDVEQSTGPSELRSDNLFVCQICLAHFSTRDKGQIHRDVYSRIFQCCNCKKIMGNRQKLKAHHRTHTREKPFQCNFCEKIFSECSTLRKHLLTHGPRKYKCQYCNQKFVRKDYLNKHMKSDVCSRTIE